MGDGAKACLKQQEDRQVAGSLIETVKEMEWKEEEEERQILWLLGIEVALNRDRYLVCCFVCCFVNTYCCEGKNTHSFFPPLFSLSFSPLFFPSFYFSLLSIFPYLSQGLSLSGADKLEERNQLRDLYRSSYKNAENVYVCTDTYGSLATGFAGGECAAGGFFPLLYSSGYTNNQSNNRPTNKQPRSCAHSFSLSLSLSLSLFLS